MNIPRLQGSTSAVGLASDGVAELLGGGLLEVGLQLVAGLLGEGLAH